MEVSASSMLPLGGIASSDIPFPERAGRSEETAKAFEGMFASILVKEMRQTLSDGLFGSDTADVYGALFDQYVGQQLAEGEGLGIKQLILAQQKTNE